MRHAEPEVWEKGFMLGYEEGQSEGRLQGIIIGILLTLFSFGCYYLAAKFIIKLL